MTSRRPWTTSFAGLLPAVAAVLLVTPLRAEVSFVPATNGHEARVEVRTTADGPWTSRDLPTDRTLNPSGDLLGDGFPGVATRGDWAVAAWVRPAPGQLLLAIADDDGWGPTLALPAEAAIGSPRTATLADGGVLLGWTEASPFDALSARIALLPPEGPSIFEALDGPSLVISGSELGAQAAMLALVDRGGGSFELVLASPIKPPNEPPLLSLRSLAWLDDRDGTVLDVAADATPVIQAVTGEDDVLGVVTWWSSRGELSYVLLDRDGEPSEVRGLDRKLGHSASSRAVLGHVLKAEGLEGKR